MKKKSVFVHITNSEGRLNLAKNYNKKVQEMMGYEGILDNLMPQKVSSKHKQIDQHVSDLTFMTVAHFANNVLKEVMREERDKQSD
jgi:UTP:GlnB (protein PII) uridylyltransferase